MGDSMIEVAAILPNVSKHRHHLPLQFCRLGLACRIHAGPGISADSLGLVGLHPCL